MRLIPSLCGIVVDKADQPRYFRVPHPYSLDAKDLGHNQVGAPCMHTDPQARVESSMVFSSLVGSLKV